MRSRSSPINPFVQIAQNPRRHAPDIALAEIDGVVVPRDALPVACIALHIVLVHDIGERHFETRVDLALVNVSVKPGFTRAITGTMRVADVVR